MANMRRKSRLTKDKIAQLSLANEVSVGDVRVKDEKEQVESFLLSLKDELMAGIREGIEQEVSISSPAEKSLMEQNSEMISELVGGIEQGINEGLKEYIDNNTRSLKEVLSDVSKTLQGYTEAIKKTSTTIQDTKTSTNEYSSSDSSPTPAEVGEVLKDRIPLYSPKSRGNAGKFITDVMLTSIGLGEYAKIRRNRENEEIPYGKTKVPSSFSEEDQTEALLREEKQLNEQVKQTTLLEEIRDLLKENKRNFTENATESGGPRNGSNIGIPTILPGPSKPNPSKPNPPTRANALKTILRTVSKALGPLVAAVTAAEGIIELADGKKVENVSDILPSDFDPTNVFDYLTFIPEVSFGAGAYVGDKINKGYGVVSEALGGSGSLGVDIYDLVGANTPKIEAGKGVFSKNLSEYSTTNKPDVPFDAITVGGETGEYAVPAPVTPKEVNAIPASELIDPEAAMIEGAKPENLLKEQFNKPTLAAAGVSADGKGKLIDPDQEMGLIKPTTPAPSQPAELREKAPEFNVDRQEQLAKQLGITSSKLDSRIEGGVITSINGKEVPASMLTDAEIEKVNNIRKLRALSEGVSEDKIKLLKRTQGDLQPRFYSPQQSSAKNPILNTNSSNEPQQRLRFEVTARKLPKLDVGTEPNVGTMADQISKRIVINVPPPTVVQQPSPKQTTVEQPFTNNVRNNEPSISRYIQSRYADF